MRMKLREFSLSCFLICTSFTFLWAQNGGLHKEPSPEDYFSFFSANARCIKLDHPDRGYSGRGYWIVQLANLSQVYIENGLNTYPIYQELVNILQNDKYPYNRVIAARGLPFTKNAKALGDLAKSLDDTCLFVQLEVAKSMVDLGDSKNMEVLKILAKIATSKEIEKMSEKDLIAKGENPNVLDEEMDGKEPIRSKIAKRVRKRAITGLLKGDVDYSKKIIETLKNDSDIEIRDWASGKGIK